jgi:hypothetical protein
MQEMPWLDTHLESIDEAIKLINQFAWNLSVVEHDQKWYVMTGDEEKHPIFMADSREAVDAFLYGMGLAYGCIPSPLFEKLAEDVQNWDKSLRG